MSLQGARGGYRRLRNKRPSQGSKTRRRSSPPFPHISRLTGRAGQSNISGRLFRNASHSPSARLVVNIEIRGAGRGSRYFHAWAFISQTADSSGLIFHCAARASPWVALRAWPLLVLLKVRVHVYKHTRAHICLPDCHGVGPVRMDPVTATRLSWVPWCPTGCALLLAPCKDFDAARSHSS